ncbi:MAG TPA: hypothetical protein VK203_19615 [Nostocaceae cyanobacterium]|nr:hypothetical protein [Nostocaceae cyanobacterium]
MKSLMQNKMVDIEIGVLPTIADLSKDDLRMLCLFLLGAKETGIEYIKPNLWKHCKVLSSYHKVQLLAIAAERMYWLSCNDLQDADLEFSVEMLPGSFVKSSDDSDFFTDASQDIEELLAIC